MAGRRVSTAPIARCFCSSLCRGRAIAFGRQRHASPRPLQQAPAGDHNCADLHAQDNIKAEVRHLGPPQHCKHRHQLGWLDDSEVRRFDAGAKDGGNHGLYLHGANLGWGWIWLREGQTAHPPAALGNRRGSPAWRQGQDGPERSQNSFTLLWPRALNRAGVRVSMLL